jgi:hypothetical protein
MADPVVIEQNVNQEMINSTRNLCLNKLDKLEELDNEIRSAREMIQDGLAAEPSFVSADKLVKDATKQKKVAQEQVMQTQTMRALAAKLDELKSDKKDLQRVLSDHLIEYKRLSGKDVLETVKGEQLTIFTVASVSKVPKS